MIPWDIDDTIDDVIEEVISYFIPNMQESIQSLVPEWTDKDDLIAKLDKLITELCEKLEAKYDWTHDRLMTYLTPGPFEETPYEAIPLRFVMILKYCLLKWNEQ